MKTLLLTAVIIFSISFGKNIYASCCPGRCCPTPIGTICPGPGCPPDGSYGKCGPNKHWKFIADIPDACFKVLTDEELVKVIDDIYAKKHK